MSCVFGFDYVSLAIADRRTASNPVWTVAAFDPGPAMSPSRRPAWQATSNPPQSAHRCPKALLIGRYNPGPQLAFRGPITLGAPSRSFSITKWRSGLAEWRVGQLNGLG